MSLLPARMGCGCSSTPGCEVYQKRINQLSDGVLIALGLRLMLDKTR